MRCPVGAGDQAFPAARREVKTICPYCGTGCGIFLGVRGNRVVAARGDRDALANQGRLCVKGRFGHDFVNHPIGSPNRSSRTRRARHAFPDSARPLGKKPSAWWPSAHGDQRDSGPSAIMGISSSRGTNEESYLLQKFMRAVVGTNNVDNCARVCHSPSVTGLTAVFGSGAATNPLEDIDQTEVLLLVGCNPTEAIRSSACGCSARSSRKASG